jgi:hypothetical protein
MMSIFDRIIAAIEAWDEWRLTRKAERRAAKRHRLEEWKERKLRVITEGEWI